MACLACKARGLSAAVLFVYAIPFSYAYGLLTTGTGALILFGAAQVTMMRAALASGERPHVRQWLGLFLAIGGLVYLVLPGLAAPSPAGAVLMTVAGVAWGMYSIRGHGAADPLALNAGNFVRSIPMTLIVSLAALRFRHVETTRHAPGRCVGSRDVWPWLCGVVRGARGTERHACVARAVARTRAGGSGRPPRPA